jgi:Zn-dependent protease with chaperone function
MSTPSSSRTPQVPESDAPSTAIASERFAPIGRGGYSWQALANYSLVLLVATIGGVVRCMVFAIPVWVLAAILGYSDTLSTLVIIGLGAWPLAFSLLALALPAPTAWIRMRFGGRQPSERERLRYLDAMAQLATRHPELPKPAGWFVIDNGEWAAAVLSDTLMIDRETLESHDLVVTLAHELGHLHHRDGRMALAIWRLAFLPRLLDRHPHRYGLASQIAAWVRYAASGELGLHLAIPIWAQAAREAEFEADHFVAQLGYGRQALEQRLAGAVYDQPVPFAWMKTHPHPPLELMADRLTTYIEKYPQVDDLADPFTIDGAAEDDEASR